MNHMKKNDMISSTSVKLFILFVFFFLLVSVPQLVYSQVVPVQPVMYDAESNTFAFNPKDGIASETAQVALYYQNTKQQINGVYGEGKKPLPAQTCSTEVCVNDKVTKAIMKVYLTENKDVMSYRVAVQADTAHIVSSEILDDKVSTASSARENQFLQLNIDEQEWLRIQQPISPTVAPSEIPTQTPAPTETPLPTATPTPVNRAPEVNAGADQTITLPSNVILNATVTDDGLPTNTLSTSWRVVSGPGTIKFVSFDPLRPAVQFSTPGIYTFRFTATDGQLERFDDVQITVLPQPTPTISERFPFHRLPRALVPIYSALRYHLLVPDVMYQYELTEQITTLAYVSGTRNQPVQAGHNSVPMDM